MQKLKRIVQNAFDEVENNSQSDSNIFDVDSRPKKVKNCPIFNKCLWFKICNILGKFECNRMTIDFIVL